MKTKKSTGLVIVCILLVAALALSVFALFSAKNQIAALETENDALVEENHALKAQLENMSVEQSWFPEEAYCTLVIANWSVTDNVLTATAFAEAILPDSAVSDACIELRRGETVLESQSVTFSSGDAVGIYEADVSIQLELPEIGADEELQLWLVVDSEVTDLLESCGGGWYLDAGEWMLITG